jgi:hypothetical protein
VQLGLALLKGKTLFMERKIMDNVAPTISPCALEVPTGFHRFIREENVNNQSHYSYLIYGSISCIEMNTNCGTYGNWAMETVALR